MGESVAATEITKRETDRLARKLLSLLQNAEPQSRVVVGISGVPGSGKSTLSKLVSDRTNELYSELDPSRDATPIAIDIPMDGFHYTRAQLAAMPDPQTATHRRGAAFTFDGGGFLGLVQRLTAVPATDVTAPTFDHAVKDPVADSISLSASSRIVLVEGNYCALNRAPWKEAAGLMTELWYIDVPADVCHRRVAARHLQSGICATEKDAWERATGTDELNAEDIRQNRLDCHENLALV